MANTELEQQDGLSVAESFVVRATDAVVDLTTELMSGTDPTTALTKAGAKLGLSVVLDAGLAFSRGRASAATGRLEAAAAIEKRDGLAMFEKLARESLQGGEHDCPLASLVQDHQFWRLQRNYEFEWMREPMDERRRMLEFAAAGAVNVKLSLGELARVERAMRELDPADVHLLSKVESLMVPNFQPSTPEAARWEHATALSEARTTLLRSKETSFSALVSTGCVRGGQAAVGPFRTGEECAPTELGRRILDVLKGYLLARNDVDA